MSAFCGIVNFDGAPASETALGRMDLRLARLGPDAHGVWRGGGAGFAHRMLWTTPESVGEEMPLREVRRRLVFVGDVRLDNRSEIIAALPGALGAHAQLSDCELTFLAYQAWGRASIDRLLGDFAFAIWDEMQRELFLARDHFGVKPLYYYRTVNSLLFATEIKALLAHPDVPSELNLGRLRTAFESGNPDEESTFYHGISRLPGAHWAVAGDGRWVLRRYWRLDPEKELPPRSTEEFAEEFRSLFFEAVRCRLRSASRVGSHLSGGLDSSSVTCAARSIFRERNAALPLKTFSLVFRNVPQCDEREYIQSVVDEGGVEPHFIEADLADPLAEMDDYLASEDECCYPPNTFLLERLYSGMKSAGVRVCLDGFDGDNTVSHGYLRFTELADSGHWREFAHEAAALGRLHPSVDPDQIFATIGAPHLRSLLGRGRCLAFASGTISALRNFRFRSVKSWFDHGLKPLLPSPMRKVIRGLRGGWRRKARLPVAGPVSFFTPEFVRQMEQTPVVGAAPFSARTVREEQCSRLNSGLLSYALEVTGRIYARHGIEARHPFLDRRLVEFCVALPSAQKLRDGYGRAIMRSGLRGVLPEKIRQRVTKTNCAPSYIWSSLHLGRERIATALETAGRLGGVDAGRLSGAYEHMRHQSCASEHEFLAFWNALTIALWMQRHGFSQLSTTFCHSK